ncbi:MAG: arginine repressor [Phycisphaerales bacterium JB039]
MPKRARHELIRTILREEQVASQERLRQALAQRGVEVVQATLSRDLRELGVVKGPRGYTVAGDAPRQQPGALERAIRDYLVSATTAGNFVVLRTGPGRAQPVALEIDLSPPPGVLGTVAGDATIFVATESDAASARLAARFSEQAQLTSRRTA